MPERRATRQIHVGKVPVGGDATISVQSMTKTDTRDVEATIAQIYEVAAAGCDIIRCAVPNMDAAKALKEICSRAPIPVIADIHFHHLLALESIRSGVSGIRLNPGNIRDAGKVREVVTLAREYEIPIRIGVNFGSLPPIGGIGKTGDFHRLADGVNKLAKASQEGEGDYSVIDHMVATALWEVGILEEMGFDQIKISVKGFDVPMTVEAYRRVAERVDYPLHLGITEAGTPFGGSIRSAIGIGHLLYEGIGDTIRVSLAGDPVREVEAGWEILKSLNLRNKGVTLIACPPAAARTLTSSNTRRWSRRRSSRSTSRCVWPSWAVKSTAPARPRTPMSASPQAQAAASSSARVRRFASSPSLSSSRPSWRRSRRSTWNRWRPSYGLTERIHTPGCGRQNLLNPGVSLCSSLPCMTPCAYF